MRTILSFSFLCLFFIGCNQGNLEKQYAPDNYIDSIQQDSFTYSISRYISRLPVQATHLNKFDPKFDSTYRVLANRHELIALHKESDAVFFLFVRQAPSLQKKYVAIGGKMKSTADSIIYYEEVFRTWKKPMHELKPLAFKLFDEMVKGEDLTKYYPEHSGDEYIIEFPSSEVYFDTKNRIWKRKKDAFKLDL